jgi:hypothetical protein
MESDFLGGGCCWMGAAAPAAAVSLAAGLGQANCKRYSVLIREGAGLKGGGKLEVIFGRAQQRGNSDQKIQA